MIIAAEDTGYRVEIESYGLTFINIGIKRSSTNIFTNLKTLFAIYKLYKSLNPDIIHNVSIKPVLYGSFLGRLMRRKIVVNALGGMGHLFTEDRNNKLVMWLFKRFTRFAFQGKNMYFILQNKDDIAELQNAAQVRDKQILMIEGSGVDLEEFPYVPEPINEPIILLLHARMIWDKGIAQFKEMAERLNEKYSSKVKCVLCGGSDDNRTTVSEQELNQWNDEGIVQWIGSRTDIKDVVANCHIAVLPSFYREGLPKSLIEATAIGRPIITTDSVGCRETVEHGVNGYLVPIKNVEKLVEYASMLIEDANLRKTMGLASRKRAENKFDVRDVSRKTLDLYKKAQVD